MVEWLNKNVGEWIEIQEAKKAFKEYMEDLKEVEERFPESGITK